MYNYLEKKKIRKTVIRATLLRSLRLLPRAASDLKKINRYIEYRMYTMHSNSS